MEFSRLLSSKQESARFDKLLFLNWETGKMKIDQVIKLFKRNNLVTEDADINESEMETWLNSLGYRKEKNENKISDSRN